MAQGEGVPDHQVPAVSSTMHLQALELLMAWGALFARLPGVPPQNAGAVNLKKTYENASTSFKHGGLQQIPLFGKTYGAGAVKKCTAKETCPKVCHNATENTYVKRG